MDDAQIKETLKVEAAKSVVVAGLGRRESLFTTLLTLASIFVPAYPTMLALTGPANDIHVLVRLAPLFLWITSVVVCIWHLFPRIVMFDLGDINGILEQNARRVEAAQRHGALAAATFLAGIALAAIIIVWAGAGLGSGSQIQAPVSGTTAN
jgi:hypothetical protein